MADNLTSILKQIGKKYGENVAKIGADDLTVDGVLSFGRPMADHPVYGGIPEGRIVEFSGAEGSEPLDIMKARLVLAGIEKAAHIRIWLDDVREAPKGYHRCKSVNEAKRLIEACEREETVIEVIDCDHDLGDYAADGGDGIKLIDRLAERGAHYPIALQTMDPVGRENMQREIERYWRGDKFKH